MESYVLVPKNEGRGYDRVFKSDVAWRNAIQVASQLQKLLSEVLASCLQGSEEESLLNWGRQILIEQRRGRIGWKGMKELIVFLSGNWDRNGCPHPKSASQFVNQLISIRNFKRSLMYEETPQDSKISKRDRLIFKLIGRKMKQDMDLSVLGEFCRKHISCMRLGKLGEEYLDEKTLNELLK